VVPAVERIRLPEVGRAVYAEGGFVDVSAFYVESFTALGLSTDQFAERLIADLVVAAEESSDEWAFPGALHVAVDFDGPNVASRAAGESLINRALSMLADRGVGGGRIPGFLVLRYGEICSGRG
jgi:hypothetical protein